MIEFVGEHLHVRASRQFPCVFNLYEPKEGRVVMYPDMDDRGVGFFPKVFLNHAFEVVYNPYSPVLFLYKLANYEGVHEQSLDMFSGNEHVLFHDNRYSLLHYYAYHNREDLLDKALQGNAPLLFDGNEESPLSIALKRKAYPCVKTLLAHLA